MLKHLRIAAIALPAALTVMAPIEARANPMVAVGWLWAAGAGGVVLGVLGTVLYQQNHYTVVTPVQAQPIAYEPNYGNCHSVVIKYQGRSRRAQICD